MIFPGQKFYILFHMLDTFYKSSFYPCITLKNFASSYHKMSLGSMNNMPDWHELSHKWDKIGPSHFLSEPGDLSFLLFLFKTVLGRENSGNISKKTDIINFISDESPLRLFGPNTFDNMFIYMQG